jgi:uncharacterized protein (DUF779 family)
MKRCLAVLALGLLMAVPAAAQRLPMAIPQTEVFVGASYYRAGVTNGLNLVGWQSAFDYNVYKHVGVVLDLGGAYKTTNGTTLGLYQYMLGPRFKARRGRVTAFAEGLVGGDAAHVPNHTRGAFAVGFGGGFDVYANRIVSIRILQVDSIHDHTEGVWGHSLRVGAGVVFKFPKP